MEVFQNGRFSTGEPVYQIGTKNADGTYDIEVFDLMTKSEAEARLLAMGGVPAAPEPEVKVPTVARIKAMTKNELEAMMRSEGIELDKRRAKATLVAQVIKHFKDK